MWNDGTLVELKWYRFGLFKTLQWLPVALRINPKLLPSPARPIPDSVSSPITLPPFPLVQPHCLPWVLQTCSSHLCWLGMLDTTAFSTVSWLVPHVRSQLSCRLLTGTFTNAQSLYHILCLLSSIAHNIMRNYLVYLRTCLPTLSGLWALCPSCFHAVFPAVWHIVVQFSSVQFSRSVVSNSLRPHELQHARPPCPSPTPGVHSSSVSIELVIPSSHLTLCCPLLLLPPVPPSIRVFSNEGTLHMRWPKYWSFSFSISPSNEHPGLISFRMG